MDNMSSVEIIKEQEVKHAIHTLNQVQREAGLPDDLRQHYSQMYIDYYLDSSRSNEYPALISNPIQVDEKTLDRFSYGHSLLYSSYLLTLVSEYGNWNNAVHIGPMYSGKSTFGLRLVEDLKRYHGVDTAIYITGAMEETYITSRARIENPQRKAMPFGGYSEEGRQIEIQKILERPEEAILLDEYTFANTMDVVELIRAANSPKYNKKLILLGLNTNYLGIDLDIFDSWYFKRILGDERTKQVPGHSYLPEDKSPHLEKPRGEGTIRYINIGDALRPLYLLDLGIGKLIISKEKDYILYKASRRRLTHLFGENRFFEFILRETKPDNQTDLSRLQSQFTGYIESKYRKE